MIIIAILEKNKRNADKIKDMLIKYSVKKNVDFRTLWFSTEESMQKLGAYIPNIHIALISLGNDGGIGAGMRIYSGNSECRILYYSVEPCELEPLFRSRPIEFHHWTGNDDVMLGKLDAVVNELVQSNAVFRYQTRKKLLLIPERNILYFQSNLKNVEIHKTVGKAESLFSKLSEIEKKLSYRFVRIHQSFIVNVDQVISIGRDTHMVTLRNGESIPLSDARYQDAVRKIDELRGNMQF